MSESPRVSRRGFMQHASIGLGMPVLATAGSAMAGEPASKAKRLPREVWVGTVAQSGLNARTPKDMTKLLLARMKELLPYQPDIICLPEVCSFVNLSSGRPSLAKSAEEPIGRFSRPFAQFAAEHKCYVMYPTYTVEDKRYYNAAVLIDREGQYVGQYRKMHPTLGEIEGGIMPGPVEPYVFRTDFGLVGAQICFDIEWSDGWRKLEEAGAELVFWPSAFAGGSMVNTKAWENHYCVVSSTRKGVSKICDVTGEELACTGHFAHSACAAINLEKAFLHTWPFCRRFDEIQAKYGRKVRITTFHEEEWSIIESRSADVRVADILKEFELETHRQHINAADRAQQKYR
jgi:beta-ureidopropionase